MAICVDCKGMIQENDEVHEHKQTGKKSHAECYRKWVDQKVKEGIQFYLGKKMQLQTYK